MDSFYLYVDIDISSNSFVDYEMSFAKLCTYDFNRLSDIEKAVLCFTVVIRFARCGMVLKRNGNLWCETIKAVDYVKKSTLTEFDENDRDQLFQDIDEVTGYLEWAEEKLKERGDYCG